MEAAERDPLRELASIAGEAVSDEAASKKVLDFGGRRSFIYWIEVEIFHMVSDLL